MTDGFRLLNHKVVAIWLTIVSLVNSSINLHIFYVVSGEKAKLEMLLQSRENWNVHKVTIMLMVVGLLNTVY